MNITKVLGSRVLIEQIVDVAKKDDDGGIVVAPASVNPSYFTGIVKAVGEQNIAYIVGHSPDAQRVGVEVGNKVAYLKYGYEDMGDNLHIVEEASLLAVIE